MIKYLQTTFLYFATKLVAFTDSYFKQRLTVFYLQLFMGIFITALKNNKKAKNEKKLHLVFVVQPVS